MPDWKTDGFEAAAGFPDKRTSTVDKPVTIVTTAGDYQGNINLNFSNVQISRISDLFSKSDFSFLPLYNAVVRGQTGTEVLLNIKDVALVIPGDTIATPSPELRRDALVTVKLKYELGQLVGKANLWGETQQVDRISDLLNFPGKKWLILYEASYRGKDHQAVIVNLDFISTVVN